MMTRCYAQHTHTTISNVNNITAYLLFAESCLSSHLGPKSQGCFFPSDNLSHQIFSLDNKVTLKSTKLPTLTEREIQRSNIAPFHSFSWLIQEMCMEKQEIQNISLLIRDDMNVVYDAFILLRYF